MARNSDMTKGNPTKLLIGFAIPLLIGNVFQQLYNAVDGIIVGRFEGPEAFAAVSAAFPIYSIVMFLSMGLGSGITVLVSQLYGYGDKKKLKTAVSTAYMFLGILALIMTAVGLLVVRNTLNFMSVPPDIYDDCMAYLTIVFAGLLATLAYNGFSSMLRAIGDSRTPLYFLIIASLSNIVLDLVFVVVFGWGVAGVAFATILAQALSAILCAIYISKRIEALQVHKGEWVFDKDMLKQILRFGIPSAIQMSMISVGMLVMQGLVNGFGTASVAAYGAANKVDNFGSMFIFSLNDSLAVFAGQNIGAGLIDRAKDGLKRTIRTNFIAGTAIGLAIFFFGRFLIAAFLGGGDPEIVRIGTEGLRLISWSYPVYAIMFCFTGFLRGAGDVRTTMVSNILMVVVRIPIAYLLAATALQVNGPLLAMPISWTIASIIPIIRYFSGKWKGKAAVQKQEQEPVADGA